MCMMIYMHMKTEIFSHRQRERRRNDFFYKYINMMMSVPCSCEERKKDNKIKIRDDFERCEENCCIKKISRSWFPIIIQQ